MRAALVSWLGVGVALGVFASPAPARATNLAPVQARTALEGLGISYDIDSYFQAVQKDDVNIVKLFHAAGTAIDVATPVYERTGLLEAADYGSYRVFQYLLDAGANPNLSAESGSTPLIRAISHRRHGMVWALLRAGARAHMRKKANRSLGANSALNYGLLGCNPELTKALLAAGASVSERYYGRGATPLMTAADKGCLGNVEVLIDAGADIHAVEKDGKSVLLAAVGAENVSFDVVRVLVEAGANVNGRDRYGYSPTFVAAMQGDPYVLQLLLGHGAVVDERTRFEEGAVPFRLYEYDDLVDALSDGATPLMVAATLGHNDAVHVLLEAGADATAVATGKKKHTARSLAAGQDHDAIVADVAAADGQ